MRSIIAGIMLGLAGASLFVAAVEGGYDAGKSSQIQRDAKTPHWVSVGAIDRSAPCIITYESMGRCKVTVKNASIKPDTSLLLDKETYWIENNVFITDLNVINRPRSDPGR